jgi:hypothetical protein
MTLLIEVEVIPGTDIEDAKKEAFQLANKLQCDVVFEFNGREYTVDPLGRYFQWNDHEEGGKRWKEGTIKF